MRKYTDDQLFEMLIVAIRDNWPRIRENYTKVLDNLGDNDSEVDIDKRLLYRLRQDAKKDGSQFIETPDGISSRINDWLFESFPGAFR